MYFDEAHILHSQVALPNEHGRIKTLYDVLCKTFDDITHCAAILYLSTVSHLVDLAAPRGLANSNRVLEGKALLQPPITEIGFDFGPALPLRPGEIVYDLDALSKMSYLASFGRPL